MVTKQQRLMNSPPEQHQKDMTMTTERTEEKKDASHPTQTTRPTQKE